MTDHYGKERQRLITAYRKTSGPARAVVKLLAINWGPLGKTKINTALKKTLGVDEAKGIDYNALTRAKLIVSQNSWHSGYACNPLLLELVARDAVLDGTFNLFVDLARAVDPLQKSYYDKSSDGFVLRTENELIRETRLGLYWRDEAYIGSVFRVLEKCRNTYFHESGERWSDPSSIYGMVCSNPFDSEWFQGLPLGIRIKALPATLHWLALDWRTDAEAKNLLEQGCLPPVKIQAWHETAALLAIYQGDWQTCERHLEQIHNPALVRAIKGLLVYLQAGLDSAIGLFRDGLSALRRESHHKKIYFNGPIGLFFIFALHQRNAPGDLEDAEKLMAYVDKNDPLELAYRLLAQVVSLERSDSGTLEKVTYAMEAEVNLPGLNPWVFWTGLMLLYRYQSLPRLIGFSKLLAAHIEKAQNAGFHWLAAEMAFLLGAIDVKQTGALQQASEFEASSGIQLLGRRIHREAGWERALKAISNTVAKPRETKDKAAETRLAWYVSEDQHAPLGYSLEVREQTRNAKGLWNKGKVVSFKRLRENAAPPPGLSAQDARAVTHIVVDRYTNAHYLNQRGWLSLAGHPHVYWQGSGSPLELALAEPEMRLQQLAETGEVLIEFWPRLVDEHKVVLVQDGLSRLKLIEVKAEHQRLAEIIGEGLKAPMAAQERVLASLSTVSSLVTIHSDIGGAELSSAQTVEADPSLRIQLIPEGEGLRIAFLVRPFGDQGSYFAPGAGGAGLIAEINGQRLQTQRVLAQERELAKTVLELCPTLGDGAQPIQEWQWLADNAECSLECLLELHELGDKAQVEWPQGEKYKMLGQAGLGRFSMKIQQQRDWFSLSGELALDNGEIINMQRLLELTAGSRSKFVRLDENRFIALTESFRRRLDDLRTYTEKHGKDHRLNALAMPVMEEIAEEVGEFQTDLAWRKQIDRLRQAEQIQPKLPSTLQAELREYQQEGFAWLSRLAAWGVGACLADDMGLGKTLQAIALILSRAGEGPSLVVAPTSVCFNWQNELDRFAPTLNVRLLGSSDRQQLVDSLKPLDLLICSYGLLQQESVGEMLADTRFSTIVLDEAQAIKNPATKRSQRAMSLQGDFKLITTGTPVENHLGELWNLMRFTNPGLLGSLESFNRRFAGPIERDQDREARLRLKKLIQPFILRRTKSQVLEELPPRTEIELQVELSEKEATFYEALRRRLLDELSVDEGPIQDKRFKVLAAITKLRRACCNPELVAPGLGLGSSKLELFGEVLGELLENHHKALVFSQFVDHLSIIREYLEGKGISYQYLDGQTPAAERKKRVEAFQLGSGDVFLISLKAGGVGLNLTAADYVIHMDPWWNPAVEDQASDRAHRIGQHRPVTVYRLVAKNTIEEQIVSLHRQKRDLADSLLEGGEISGKIGAEELLQLMQGI